MRRVFGPDGTSSVCPTSMDMVAGISVPLKNGGTRLLKGCMTRKLERVVRSLGVNIRCQ